MTTMYLSVLSLLLLSVMANNSSCGGDRPSKVSDCQLVDLGSCGNACCNLQLVVPSTTPVDTYTAITNYLKKSGSDGSYGYSNGADAAGHNPSDDLRPYNLTWKFIFQGTHKTIGGYVDKINFNIKETLQKGSTVTMFSSSGIHGALGDNGQNYKSLAFLSKDLGWSPKFFVIQGCGKKVGFLNEDLE